MALNKNWLHAAGVVWPHLVKAARNMDTLYYSDLAPKIPTNDLNVGQALGPIQAYCIENALPPLTVLVVSKKNGKPGDGFIGATPESFEPELARAYDYDWSEIGNPFDIFSAKESCTTYDDLVEELLGAPEKAEGILRLVKTRGHAQVVFRLALMSAYDEECAFCGFSFPEALEAAHIVPWSSATINQRISPQNGILLCANHHRLFDSKYISVNNEHIIEYWDPKGEDGSYSKADKNASISLHGKKLKLPENKAHWPLFS